MTFLKHNSAATYKTRTTVASLIGPALFTAAFALGIRPAWGAALPGAPYLVAAVLLALALALAWRVTRSVTGAAAETKA